MGKHLDTSVAERKQGLGNYYSIVGTKLLCNVHLGFTPRDSRSWADLPELARVHPNAAERDVTGIAPDLILSVLGLLRDKT